MSDVIAPNQTVTFTVKALPRREAQRKTIRRLMRLQPHARKGLKNLQRRRKQKDNRPHRRAGTIWVIRARATRLVHVEEGESFTITLTPQIIPDVRSVERFLEAKPAG